MSRLFHRCSSRFDLTFSRKFFLLLSWVSSRFLTTGFGLVGRVANLNLGGWIGEDCVCLCDSLFLSSGDKGEDARAGDDESGDDTAGR